jgi:endonuclease G, mitochondrial
MVITVDGRERMESYERERERQREAAAQRVAERMPERAEHEATLARPGGIAAADTPERIAKRVDRLRGHREVAPGASIERIVNTADFVGIRYLDEGVAAARAIGRVNIRDGLGRLQGYGTGSLVSPALLLTNHHVLPDAATATKSTIEFDYQDGVDGRPLHPQVFPLDPDRLFIADEERDCALVAVRATPSELAPYGFNRLIDAEGGAIIGEYVTIVQHPRGEKKQIALRENKIVDVPDLFLHYVADTEPGSSGSLVFNDEWEAVALHHASVPAPEHEHLGGYVNEGIRISRVVEFVKQQRLPPEQRALADAIFAPARPELRSVPAPEPAQPDGAVTLTVPIQITVRVGDAGQNAVLSASG